MNCAAVREALPTYVADGERILSVRRHLGECDSCRAELARYQQLLSSLGRLESVTLQPPPELATALAAIPQQTWGLAGAARERADALAGHLARNRRAYIGGMGIALAGAASAALWRSRARWLVAT
jgi:hypothetical protein